MFTFFRRSSHRTANRFGSDRFLTFRIARVLVPLLFTLMLTGISVAAPPHLIDASVNEIQLGSTLELLEDPAGKASLLQVQASTDWIPSPGNEPNLGFTQSAWWFRTTVIIQRDDLRTWYLQINDALLNEVEVYFISPDNQIVHKSGGGSVPMSQRDIPYRTHVFELPKDKSYRTKDYHIEIYARVKSQLAVIIPARLIDSKRFSTINTGETWIYALYFGFVSATLLFNLVSWLRLRETFNLIYCGFSLSLMLTSLAFSGLGKQFLWPEAVTPDNVFVCIVGSLSCVFAISFSWVFLYNSTLAALFSSKRILLLLSPAFVCIVLAMGGFITLCMHLLAVSIVTSAVFIVVNSVREYRRGNPNAGIFLIAWLGLLVGCSIFSLRGMGVIPSNLFTTNSIWVGSGFECLLLVIALIEKSRQHREEAQLATQRAMVLLEEKVAQRTRELANTQEKLVQSEKMAALGVFTAGMAHEINNPANFVSAGVQNAAAATDRFEHFVTDLLEEEADAEITAGFSQHFTKLRSQHDLIRTGIDRITTIVTRLRATHPEGETGLMPVNLADLTESAWSLTESQLRIPVTFQCQANGNTVVRGVAAELQQALLAIFGNAALAIEEACKVRGEGYAGALHCRMHRLEDHTIRVVIEDNGIGIPAGLLDKVFDPFFTTREIGKGAGLGLSMTRNIIEKHCGWISLESTEGRGTRVVVTLPSV